MSSDMDRARSLPCSFIVGRQRGRTSFARVAGLALVAALTGSSAALSAMAAPTTGAPEPVTSAPEVKTGIKLTVRPAEVQVFLDGKERGTAGELSFIPTGPGRYGLRLVHGGDELEVEVVVKKAQVVEFAYDFE